MLEIFFHIKEYIFTVFLIFVILQYLDIKYLIS